MRLVVLLALTMLALPLASAGAPAPGLEMDGGAPRTSLDVGAADEALVDLARGQADPLAVLLAQLSRQDGRSRSMLAAGPAAPPDFVYRDVRPACDLDGDSIADVVVNNLTLARPPSHARAASELEALSGRTGERLWKVDNLAYASMPAPRSVPYGPRGAAFPDAAGSARPVFDLDADGACDVIAYGFDGLPSYSAPIVGEPSVSNTRFTLRALSGRTGEPLWSMDIDTSTTSASDPLLGTSSNVLTRGFPTGVLTYDAPDGPRVVVKLTDLRYHMGDMPVSTGGIPTLDPRKELLKGPAHVEDVRITEHVQARDARTGELVWQRDLGSETTSADVDTRFTNLTWLAGVADLGGDAEPDLVLDQLVITTPRTMEANHPVSGDTLFRYGRGARATALDGATGASLWVANLLEPLAAEPNARTEENLETLLWARSDVVPDIDGDGRAEVLATYTSQEEGLSATIVGAYRTHFVPLSGANGTALWNVRQQGWGVARAIDDAPVERLALGMLDVPVAPPEGGQFPPRFVRMLVVDAKTGETGWSYERAFAQNSILSYNLGLSQFNEALAPHDWDGDGVRDLVTPAQEAPRTDRDQVLLATSSHTYGILSGADGHELANVRAWGPDGRVLSCPGDEARLTVLSGHARRLELARFEALTGERAWRSVIHNDAAPRAATTAIDATALGATCMERGDGTFFAVDLQAFSFDRGHEVVPILGLLDAEGGPAWQTPPLRGSPPSDALFQASIDDGAPSTASLWGATAFAVAFGLAGAFVTIALLARAESRLLVVGLVLVVLAPGALSLTLPLAQPPEPAGVAPGSADPAPGRESSALTSPATPTPFSPADAVAAVRALVLGQSFDNASLSRFSGQDTLTFTHAVGDVDGDGWDDLILDQYCRSGDGCENGIRIPEDGAAFLTSSRCGYAHDIVLANGRNGSLVWSKDLSVYGPENQCGEHFVVGPIDAGGEMAVLLYRYQLIWYSGVNIDGVALHDFIALSAATGEPIWTYSVKGTYASDFAATYVAKDYVVVPVLQGTPGEGQALFLQGVGWTTTASSSIFPVVPGYPLTNDQVVLWNVHEPIEWAARLDLATGAELWKRDTFQPTPGVNALPVSLPVNLARAWSYSSFEQGRYFWDARTCCGDVTGDGVPDLVFEVYEWGQTPMARLRGPTALDVRLVVYDGATGNLHLDQYGGRDLPTAMDSSFNDRYNFLLGIFIGRFTTTFTHEPVGDADADGADDLLQHVTVRSPEYRQNLSLVSGSSGKTLWSMETHRDLRALVLGDADGDGGNDFLLLDWYGHEAGQPTQDDFATPSAVPLTMVSGRTGERIWRVTSYAAPADILESFKTVHRSGVVDVDADGVGDFFADDPLYLDDQTVVHQTSVISGRDGSPLRTMRSVGAFAIPAGASDLDHDGRGEVALLSGDVNDLWLTVYDGATGAAEWSRRIMALPASGYAEALPMLKLDPLATPETADAVAVTFHIDVTRPYTGYGVCVGCGDEEVQAGEWVGQYLATMPQILRVRSNDGALDWALPELDTVDGAARVLGATPGSAAFDTLAERASAVGLLSAAGRDARPFALPTLGGFGIAYALGLAAGIAVARFRSRFTGVPDLE